MHGTDQEEDLRYFDLLVGLAVQFLTEDVLQDSCTGKCVFLQREPGVSVFINIYSVYALSTRHTRASSYVPIRNW